jgi:hypothetical protein
LVTQGPLPPFASNIGIPASTVLTIISLAIWHIAYTSLKRLGWCLDINLRIILFSRLLCDLLKKIFGKMGEMAVTNN